MGDEKVGGFDVAELRSLASGLEETGEPDAAQMIRRAADHIERLEGEVEKQRVFHIEYEADLLSQIGIALHEDCHEAYPDTLEDAYRQIEKEAQARHELDYRDIENDRVREDLIAERDAAFEAGARAMQRAAAELAEYPLEGKGWIWSKGVDEVCDHIEAKIRAINPSTLER